MIDIEELKIKVCNHLCKVGRQSTKECSYLYKMGQALEQQQAELSVARKLIDEYSQRSKINNLALEQQQARNEELEKVIVETRGLLYGHKSLENNFIDRAIKELDSLPKPPEDKS